MPLDPEVDHAAALADRLAEAGQQERRGQPDPDATVAVSTANVKNWLIEHRR